MDRAPRLTPDHPRIRGEHRGARRGLGRAGGSSPHTRGARGPDGGGQVIPRIIPAYAGSTNLRKSDRIPSPDHPRIRGEHRSASAEEWSTAGSSPHTRGAPPASGPGPAAVRIIPAYAGSTPCRACRGCVRRGSSPHTRGAPPAARTASANPRIIPAYAGSTPPSRSGSPAGPDHPRIRGEHHFHPRLQLRLQGSSPHTRGAPSSPGLVDGLRGIIPAYAGSTGAGVGRRYPPRDHPRIRGEHSDDEDPVELLSGSSPHTRGAPGGHFHVLWRRGSSPHTRGAHCLCRRR